MVWWKFWKKEEDELAAFEKELGLGARAVGMEEEKPTEETYDRLARPEEFGGGMPEQPRFEPQKPLQQFAQTTDLQLISAKLDTIKAMLDVLNQRLESIERNVQEKSKKAW